MRNTKRDRQAVTRAIASLRSQATTENIANTIHLPLAQTLDIIGRMKKVILAKRDKPAKALWGLEKKKKK